MKTAFITGIGGQDGSYLAELLLSKGYAVHGLMRRSSTFNTRRIDGIFDRLHCHYGDMTDGSRLARLMAEIQPNEVYNLAAQSHVQVSFAMPEYTHDVNATGTVRLLEAIRLAKITPKFYQASSSEMFGNSPAPQNEGTPFDPQSPYAVSKVAAYYAVKNFRAQGNFACNGILFNHESPRRGETFVTRKITRAVARIYAGLQNEIILGNLKPMRDWGYAKDYVEAMWLMLQQHYPDDYVVATGESHTVLEFLEIAFKYLGMQWSKYVKFDVKYTRPQDVWHLQGNFTKAQERLLWKPKTDFQDLVKLMVDADLKELTT